MFDYTNAIARCEDNSLKVLLKKIEHYKEYSFLCTATGMAYKTFREIFPQAPAAIKTWYKFANGGLLFDTLLLSVRTANPELVSTAMSLSMYNGKTVRAMAELPPQYAVFAIASFGDYYCFDQSGQSNEIYQWSVSEHCLAGKWSNFPLWLRSEISGAEELISDELLFPMSIHSTQGGAQA